MAEYVIYARKSTESEDRQVLSIPAQLDELRAVAARRGIVIGRIVEESRSAKAPGRPAFASLLADIQKGRVQGVLCWKLDRLARNPVDGGALIWALAQGQIREIVSPGRIYTGSSDDKFLMNLEFGMAGKYIDDLSDNIKRGMRARVGRGWCPSRPPPGYLPDRTDPERRVVVTDPERFPLIRRAFDLILKGVRPNEVLRLLNDVWGYRTPLGLRGGGKPLSRPTFYELLGNTFYYGWIRFKGELFAGKHEPMLSADEFRHVQRVLRREERPHATHHDWAFTGLIRCGTCDGMVTASWSRGKCGGLYAYYHCGRRKAQECRQSYLRATLLEAQIVTWLDSITLPDEVAAWYLDAIEDLRLGRDAAEAAQRRGRDEARQLAERQLRNLTSLRLRDLLSDEEFVAQRLRLVNELNSLKAAPPEDPFEPAKRVVVSLNQAKRRFSAGTSADKRAIVASIGSNPVLLGRKLHIEAQEPFSLFVHGGASPANWSVTDVNRTLARALLRHCQDLQEPPAAWEPNRSLLIQ